MTDDEQIERNKLAAARGWIIQPPPATAEPLPAHRIGKWRGCTVRDRHADVTRRVLTGRGQVAMAAPWYRRATVGLGRLLDASVVVDVRV